jgi:hypothetical protein
MVTCFFIKLKTLKGLCNINFRDNNFLTRQPAVYYQGNNK